MIRSRAIHVALLALVLVLAAPMVAAAADCDYDVSFARNGAGDIDITGTANCGGPISDQQTFLFVTSPISTSASDYGSSVTVTVADAAGSQQYCASVSTTYRENGFLVLDEGGASECAYF